MLFVGEKCVFCELVECVVCVVWVFCFCFEGEFEVESIVDCGSGVDVMVEGVIR